jgi:hypothetical protein
MKKTKAKNDEDLMLLRLAQDEKVEKALKQLPTSFFKIYAKKVDADLETLGTETAKEFVEYLVEKLYCAVGPRALLKLVRIALKTQPQFKPTAIIFCKKHFKKCDADYYSLLSRREREIYSQLNDVQQVMFRICHDLARYSEDKGIFFLSCNQLAERLDVVPMTAYRMLKAFCNAGVLKLVLKGTKRAKKQPGVATTYRWNLPTRS